VWVGTDIENRSVRAVERPVNPGDYRPPVDINIRRHYVEINPIDALITSNLQVVLIIAGLFNLNRRYILELILRQLHLKYDQMSIISDLLDNPYEIDFPVFIQVEIVYANFWVVERPFKCFKIL
jgi:hypothetical protein